MAEPYPKSKQLHSKRIKPTQKQLGDISPAVREEVKERSNSICEVRMKCTGARAYEMAHLIGRKQLTWKTTAADIKHACVECHRWLDTTTEGIRYKRSLVKLPFDDDSEIHYHKPGYFPDDCEVCKNQRRNEQ